MLEMKKGEQIYRVTHPIVEVLSEPEIESETPFLAINKSVVTMVRGIKE